MGKWESGDGKEGEMCAKLGKEGQGWKLMEEVFGARRGCCVQQLRTKDHRPYKLTNEAAVASTDE